MPRSMAMIGRPYLPLAGGLALCLASCGTDTAAPGNAAGNELPAAEEVSRAPAAVEQPLARRDILLAVVEAASSHAAGTGDGARQQALDGRPFRFRIGLCDARNDDFSASFEEEERVLRVAVRPNLDEQALRSAGFDLPEDGMVEGFWIPRPWLLAAACPPAPAAGPAPTGEAEPPPVPAPPLVGIAQFGAEGRAQSIVRDGRAYEVTRKLEEGTAPGPIELVLEGRLQRRPGGRVISCAGRDPARPPTCVVSVRLDGVRLEQAGGELLAEWRED
jgi:hypothetical protein